jgi:hypothetical protein
MDLHGILYESIEYDFKEGFVSFSNRYGGEFQLLNVPLKEFDNIRLAPEYEREDYFIKHFFYIPKKGGAKIPKYKLVVIQPRK